VDTKYSFPLLRFHIVTEAKKNIAIFWEINLYFISRVVLILQIFNQQRLLHALKPLMVSILTLI
jgi:hypothetical protein